MDTTNVAAGMSDAEMAAGLAGLQPPPLVEPPAPTPAVRWLTEKKRTETYDLVHPFVLEGIVYRHVTVRRLTAGEVAAFIDRLRAPKSELRFPMFFIGGAEITDAAWDAMDDDDRFALVEISEDFLPARFRRPTAPPPSASIPLDGGTSGSS